MAKRGSTANVVAGIASFLVPGLGQLVQGRILAAIFFFVLTGILWIVTFTTLGWIGNVIAALNAALYESDD
jgi:TM2 domain-containing membrane protein YozV